MPYSPSPRKKTFDRRKPAGAFSRSRGASSPSHAGDRSKPYVPRTRGASAPSRANRAAPAPLFPQKPPYRPNGSSTVSVPARASHKAVSRYGFLPNDKKPVSHGASRSYHAVGSSRTLTGASSVRPVARKFSPPKPPRTKSASYTPKQASESWGGVAKWYEEHLATRDTYHEKVILPNLVRLVDPKKSDNIVDLACGTGYFTEHMAKTGATLTGVDVSPELIATAQKNTPGISYYVSSAEKMNVLGDASADKAMIVLAIQNIEHVQGVFQEVVRILKPGGMFHVVMNHPAFRIPKNSSWEYDDKKKVQFRRIDQYLSESRSEIDMHPGMKDSPKTLSFHRPLQYYFKALAKTGFAVDRLEEWISHKASDSGPRAKAENNARKEIPLFLYLGAMKK